MSSREEKVESLMDLQDIVCNDDTRSFSMIHCAVTRKSWRNLYITYRHHYIILGHTWSENGCYIIHYASRKKVTTKAEVVEEYKKDFKEDIDAGLCIYTNDDYPQTDEQYFVAYARFQRRKKETNYSVRFNNCEHLTLHILTGNAVSMQVNEASKLKFYIMTLVDYKGTAAAVAAVLLVIFAMVAYKNSESISRFFKTVWDTSRDPYVFLLRRHSIDWDVLSRIIEESNRDILRNIRPEVLPFVLPSLPSHMSKT